MEDVPQKSQEEIIKELQEIRNRRLSIDEDLLEADTRRYKFVEKLRKEFPEQQLYATRLFNVLNGSGEVEEIPVTSFDLPGGEIENFIRNEL